MYDKCHPNHHGLLQREIMFIDGASYEEAAARVEELRSSCMAGSTL